MNLKDKKKSNDQTVDGNLRNAPVNGAGVQIFGSDPVHRADLPLIKWRRLVGLYKTSFDFSFFFCFSVLEREVFSLFTGDLWWPTATGVVAVTTVIRRCIRSFESSGPLLSRSGFCFVRIDAYGRQSGLQASVKFLFLVLRSLDLEGCL